VETFTPWAFPHFIANHCGVPVSITRGAAIWEPLLTLASHTRVLTLRISPRALARRIAWVQTNRYVTRCYLRPRGVGWHLPGRTFRVACAQVNRIGTFPKLAVLGASYRFRAFTLHLVTFACPTPSAIRGRLQASGWLARPCPGGLLVIGNLADPCYLGSQSRRCLHFSVRLPKSLPHSSLHFQVT